MQTSRGRAEIFVRPTLSSETTCSNKIDIRVEVRVDSRIQSTAHSYCPYVSWVFKRSVWSSARWTIENVVCIRCNTSCNVNCNINWSNAQPFAHSDVQQTMHTACRTVGDVICGDQSISRWTKKLVNIADWSVIIWVWFIVYEQTLSIVYVYVYGNQPAVYHAGTTFASTYNYSTSRNWFMMTYSWI